MPLVACIGLVAHASQRAIVALACLGAVAALAQTGPRERGYTQVLDTPSFAIRIEVQCPEGEVTCEDVSLRAENKQTKRVLNLGGRTSHRMCADNVTPCRFLGYVFRSDTLTCFIGDGGEFLLQEGQKVLVQESGAWR